jgi:hypothetical protein
MKILMKTTFLVSLLTIGLGTTFATSTDELQIKSGSFTATITDATSVGAIDSTCTGNGCFNNVSNPNGILGDSNPNAETTTAAGTINGWLITVTSGTSFSPADDPFGLDVSSLSATCVGGAAACSASPLDIKFSDISFSPANPAFLTGYSATISGSGSGSTSESAYYSNTNNIFAETTLIGTVGPFTATSGGSATGGVGSVAPYSLTLDEVFTDTGTNPISFSVDGSLSSVPEPGAIVLLGSILVLCAGLFRRRRLAQVNR